MEAVVAAKPVIKVASLCESLRKGSFNRGLIQTALEITKESINGIQMEYIDISRTPLKNAIDCASRLPNVWGDKAAAIISAGGGFGGARSHYHLRQIGIYLDLHFINKPEFYLNTFQPPAKFDSDGNLIDPSSKEKIKEVLLSLQAFTLRLRDDYIPSFFHLQCEVPEMFFFVLLVFLKTPH
ncbi:NADPH:quinone oxidoreductase-like [Hibiscus syriacus]|uniref:NADPH:quinone oxidoreductase-like n=1 Tax=Hibiscus syriacus TaxID=106335 RepID=UPI001921AFCC|nr:NADPH:quinone oxidoreductase-like [Hibiscus syriacus]